MTHCVTNPSNKIAYNSRHMSIGYVLKPDYTAPAMSVTTTASYNNEKLISSTQQLSNIVRMEDHEVWYQYQLWGLDWTCGVAESHDTNTEYYSSG